MSYHRVRIRNIGTGLVSILRWSFIALVIGAVAGIWGTAFWYAVNWSDAVLQQHAWFLFLLPAAGLFIVWMNKRFGTAEASTDTVILAVQEGRRLPLLLAPAIMIGTILTHLCGGSSGREGAAFQIGGTIGNRIARLLRQNDYEIRIATMAGMAALFAAIFGLPVTATIFVVLVISVGSFWHSAIYPVMIASLTAAGIAGACGVQKVAFTTEIPPAGLLMILKVMVLAVLCAVLSTILCDGLHDTAKWLQKRLPDPCVRIVAGGVLVCVLMLLMELANGSGLPFGADAAGSGASILPYAGAGSGLIRLAIEEGTARPWDFAMKLILTVLTLAAGYKGGEVLPSFAIGATFGCVMGPLLGIPASFAAAIGLISVFGGASNSLIAPIFLGIEMFGAEGIHYYAIASVLAYVMSGYAGFYYSQVIVYSKIAPVKLNLHTNDMHDQLEDVRQNRTREQDEKQMEK